MCGILGYLGFTPTTERLCMDLIFTSSRGTDSTGIAWLSDKGTWTILKDTCQASRFVRANIKSIRSMLASKPVAILGHCRHATHGSAFRAVNAHPIWKNSDDGGLIIHNGMVDIAAAKPYKADGETDTEQLLRDMLARGSHKAMSDVSGWFAIAFARFLAPHVILLARSGAPMSLFRHRSTGGYLFASSDDCLFEKMGLESLVMPDSAYRYWTPTKGLTKPTKIERSKAPGAKYAMAKYIGPYGMGWLDEWESEVKPIAGRPLPEGGVSYWGDRDPSKDYKWSREDQCWVLVPPAPSGACNATDRLPGVDYEWSVRYCKWIPKTPNLPSPHNDVESNPSQDKLETVVESVEGNVTRRQYITWKLNPETGELEEDSKRTVYVAGELPAIASPQTKLTKSERKRIRKEARETKSREAEYSEYLRGWDTVGGPEHYTEAESEYEEDILGGRIYSGKAQAPMIEYGEEEDSWMY